MSGRLAPARPAIIPLQGSVEDTQTVKIPLLHEVVEQLKLMNSTLEEIHDELHELTNRGSY